MPYRNRDGVMRVYYGNNILPHDTGSDELRALKGVIYGDYGEGCFVPSGVPCPTPVTLYDTSENSATASDVLVIHPYPGMSYPSLEGYKAVLHCSYHSGTVCTAEGAFERFVAEAERNHIPVYYMANDGEKEYASCEQTEGRGVIKLSNITEIAAYIVIWLSVNVKI